MSVIIYTATGCSRCKIIKGLMKERGIAFTEQDMKAEGKEAFQKFYAVNRKNIFRGPEGVEFPLLYDTTTGSLHQGIGTCVAYLFGGTTLDGFFSVGTLHKEWVDGIHVSGGNSAQAAMFLEVLRYIKVTNNMKLQVDTNGLNSAILAQVLAENLADVMLINVLGPKELYSQILGTEVDISEIEKSLALATQFIQYKFQTTVVPIVRADGQIGYLTAAEVGGAAKLIADSTGSMKNPYLLKLFRPKECKDERFKDLEDMAPGALLPYRSAARAHQVFVELEKA